MHCSDVWKKVSENAVCVCVCAQCTSTSKSNSQFFQRIDQTVVLLSIKNDLRLCVNSSTVSSTLRRCSTNDVRDVSLRFPQTSAVRRSTRVIKINWFDKIGTYMLQIVQHAYTFVLTLFIHCLINLQTVQKSTENLIIFRSVKVRLHRLYTSLELCIVIDDIMTYDETKR